MGGKDHRPTKRELFGKMETPILVKQPPMILPLCEPQILNPTNNL